jgi:phosphate uptake regulator
MGPCPARAPLGPRRPILEGAAEAGRHDGRIHGSGNDRDHRERPGDIRRVADRALVDRRETINSDLERIGDQALSIALRARRRLRGPRVAPPDDIPRMTGLAETMVHRSLEALLRGDVDVARAVIEADDEVDELRDQVFRGLLSDMTADAGAIPAGLDLILVSRNLERIADHATNIAEDVIYIVRGEDVRERGEKEARQGLRAPQAGPTR